MVSFDMLFAYQGEIRLMNPARHNSRWPIRAMVAAGSLVWPSVTMSVPTNGLVAYYPFSGNADDAGGNGHHGTVMGASLTTDAAGQPDCAYYFDGTDDYISLSGFLGNPTNGTVAAWVYVESYDTGFNQLNLIYGQDDNLQFGLGDSSISADGKWVLRHHSGGFNNVVGPLAATGQWIHVAGIWTGTEIVLDVNGFETNRVASGLLSSASGSARIGAHPFASQNYWHGKIDELVIYDRALSEPEVRQLASPVPPRFTDLQILGSNVSLSLTN